MACDQERVIDVNIKIEEAVIEAEEEKVDSVEKEIQDDKLSPQPTQTNLENNNQTTATNETTLIPDLGRNRRVRQKNRYFSDFHCIDLTKGQRATKEGDTYEYKFCSKCDEKTAHLIDSGCQACLYEKIVQSHKRGKGKRGRIGNNSKQQQAKQTRYNNNNNNVSTTTTTATTKSGYKRKTKKRVDGCKSKYNEYSNSLKKNINNKIANNINNDNATQAIGNNYTKKNAITYSTSKITKSNNLNTEQSGIVDTSPDSGSSCSSTSSSGGNSTKQQYLKRPSIVKKTDSLITNSNNIDEINTTTTTTNTNSDKILRLDTWTSDDVAEYIKSNGFSCEAELFKAQSVDGISLLLMQRTDFTYGLKIKLGPALKIYDFVCKLKKEYFNIITSQEPYRNVKLAMS